MISLVSTTQEDKLVAQRRRNTMFDYLVETCFSIPFASHCVVWGETIAIPGPDGHTATYNDDCYMVTVKNGDKQVLRITFGILDEKIWLTSKNGHQIFSISIRDFFRCQNAARAIIADYFDFGQTEQRKAA